MGRARSRGYLAGEGIVVFALFPVGVTVGLPAVPVLYPLWVLAAVTFLALLRSPTFDRRELWSTRDVGPGLRPVLLRFVAVAGSVSQAGSADLPYSTFAFANQLAPPGMKLVVVPGSSAEQPSSPVASTHRARGQVTARA